MKHYVHDTGSNEVTTVTLSVRNLVDLLAQAAAGRGSASLVKVSRGEVLQVLVEPDAAHYAGREPGSGSGSHVALRNALATLVGAGLYEDEPAAPTSAGSVLGEVGWRSAVIRATGGR